MPIDLGLYRCRVIDSATDHFRDSFNTSMSANWSYSKQEIERLYSLGLNKKVRSNFRKLFKG